MLLQDQVNTHEAEVRQESKLVRQVAEASLTMSEALSSVGQARCVAKRIAECRARASHNHSTASQNLELAAEQHDKGKRLQMEALELSVEARRLQV